MAYIFLPHVALKKEHQRKANRFYSIWKKNSLFKVWQTTGDLALSSTKKNEHKTCSFYVAKLPRDMERMATKESYKRALSYTKKKRLVSFLLRNASHLLAYKHLKILSARKTTKRKLTERWNKQAFYINT